MKNLKYLLLLIVVGSVAVSCGDFLDVNTDPNNPTDVAPSLILPVGLNYTATYVQRDRGLNHLGNMMMYNYGEANGFSWYGTEFRYNVTSEFYDQMWDSPYTGSLKQYELLVNLSDEYGYYKAIGLIMQAYHFQILVDLYGDIPYSEALQRGQNPTPAYDDAAAVYDSLLVDLTNAINIIEATDELETAIPVGPDDTVFEGNMDQWIAFANTIKIRILSRASGTWSEAKINAELANIPDGAFITENVSINPGYEEEANKLNPYWAGFGTDENGSTVNTHNATAATQFVVNFFEDTNDPRIARIFDKPADGYAGVNQGFPNDSADELPDNVCNLLLNGGILKSPTMGSVIFTVAEHEFNLAELAQRGLNVPGTAQAHYQHGITASFQYLYSNAEDVDADSAAELASIYYTQSIENVGWAASSNKMDAIMTQQWLGTLAVTAAQAWFDYNRTGYPSAAPLNPAGESVPEAATGFPISSLAGSHTDRPVRLLYPQSEETTNSANVPEQTQSDAFNTKIFWAN